MANDTLHWEGVEEKTVFPGYRAKFIYAANMTFALWSAEKGAELPAHSYPHEQVTHMLEGKFELTVDGKTQVLEEGSVVTIVPDTVHAGKAVTACRMLGVFYHGQEDVPAEDGQGIADNIKVA